jgi:hypothetical protein
MLPSSRPQESNSGQKGNKMTNNIPSKIPPIFSSKKFWVSVVGIICAIIVANGGDIPDNVRSSIIDLIMVIISAYNVGQGIADGVSRGKTSGVAIRMKTVARIE